MHAMAANQKVDLSEIGVEMWSKKMGKKKHYCSTRTNKNLAIASPEDTVLNALKPVDLDEVTSLISSLSNKHCRTDPLPTWLLKECTAELAPFIC